MGQRLVVTVKNNNKDICKIYYHWSAYSYSALDRARDIVNCIYNGKDETENELLLRLIRFCEESGGGIDADVNEFAYIENLYPNETFKKDGYSRNHGLIALSEKGMASLEYWSEGDITINLDEEMIYNEVYCYYQSIEDYNNEKAAYDDEYEPQTLEDINELGYDLGTIKIEDIDNVLLELGNCDFTCRHGNEIYELVE